MEQLTTAKFSDNEEMTAKDYQAMKKHIAVLEMENEILKKRYIRKKTVK